MRHRRSGGRLLAGTVTLTGAALVAAGAAAWLVTRDGLAREHITVPKDGVCCAGRPVAGPVTAYAQARTIERNALAMAGGRSYAQLDHADPVRETVMQAAFLRASLLTSVLSFGVAALAAGTGVALLVVGTALRRLGRSSR